MAAGAQISGERIPEAGKRGDDLACPCEQGADQAGRGGLGGRPAKTHGVKHAADGQCKADHMQHQYRSCQQVERHKADQPDGRIFHIGYMRAIGVIEAVVIAGAGHEIGAHPVLADPEGEIEVQKQVEAYIDADDFKRVVEHFRSLSFPMNISSLFPDGGSGAGQSQR